MRFGAARRTQYTITLSQDRKTAFEAIYCEQLLGNYETVSSRHSTLMATRSLRRALAALIKGGMFTSFLDVGCGDLNWISALDLKTVAYTGIDISPSCIQDARQKYPDRHLEVMDIVESIPARHDFVLCKDVLNYLGHRDIVTAFNNIKKSGARYFAATAYEPKRVKRKYFPYYERYLNYNTPPGYFYPINLRHAPFHFPQPLLSIQEDYPGKSMEIWALNDLNYLNLECVEHPPRHNPVKPKDFQGYRFFRELCALPFIKRIELFGSRAAGKHLKDSDIDLLLLCSPSPTREQWLQVAHIIDHADIPLPIDCKLNCDSLGTLLDDPRIPMKKILLHERD